jgi:hypothetical protein
MYGALANLSKIVNKIRVL